MNTSSTIIFCSRFKFENNFVNQEFLPDKVKGTKFYEPKDNVKEKSIRDFLKFRWKDKYDY